MDFSYYSEQKRQLIEFQTFSAVSIYAIFLKAYLLLRFESLQTEKSISWENINQAKLYIVTMECD